MISNRSLFIYEVRTSLALSIQFIFKRLVSIGSIHQIPSNAFDFIRTNQENISDAKAIK
jgi:hypothetical protein